MTKTNDSVLNRVESLVRPEVRAMSAYHVQHAADLIKLDAMENPYHWPEEMIREWLEIVRKAEINRYPSPDASEVKALLRDVMGFDDQYDIMLGNGSDEIIQIIAMALAGNKGRGILAVEPSFVMYRVIAQTLGMPYTGVSLAENFDLDFEKTQKAIETENPALIFLAQPNNPTGNLFSIEKVRRVIENTSALVVIDEAYLAFSDTELSSLLDDYDNVLIMRTLSKVGLAGLRLGLLAGRPEWIEQFNKVRLPYNTSVLTQLGTGFALKHYDVLKQQTEQLKKNRTVLLEAMKELPGITVWNSQANFLLFRVSEGAASGVHTALKEKGILIKLLDGVHPLLKDCLRVNVSDELESGQFLSALTQILS